MPEAGRKGDDARCPADSHGCPACPHDVTGPAVEGSPDVEINGRDALRVGDRGTHAACCGPNQWQAVGGAPAVFINGQKAHRVGDGVAHCGGDGKLASGSGDVIIGDLAGGSAVEVAHDQSMDIEYTDAMGRAIGKATVHIVCPHKKWDDREFDGTVELTGLCKDAAVLVLKPLHKFNSD
ncbi:MAG: hypothetical protein JWM10_4771 [Myxococcaceae bacterium]|nr:hypothetical protein [Myxococcaceae bacterium]